MPRRLLTDRFDLGMLHSRAIAAVEPVSWQAARELLSVSGVTNIIARSEVDTEVRRLLTFSQLPPAISHAALVLEAGDDLVVAQPRGIRLPEGATSVMLEGVTTIGFVYVAINPPLGWDDQVDGHFPDSTLESFASRGASVEYVTETAATAAWRGHHLSPAYVRAAEPIIRAMFTVRKAEAH